MAQRRRRSLREAAEAAGRRPGGTGGTGVTARPSGAGREGEGALMRQSVPAGALSPNPYQPRGRIQDAEIRSLAASIRRDGVLHPIVVRPHPDRPEEWQIVSGERRWLAAVHAGRAEIPATVRDIDDGEMATLALVENMQRSDLGPIEQALAFRRLVKDHGMGQRALADRVGKSVPYVSNRMRLLDLPPEVTEMIAEGRLSAAHGVALAGSMHPLRHAEAAVRRGLTSRELERLVQSDAKGRAPGGARTPRDAHAVDLENRIELHLGLGCRIRQRSADSGELVVRYTSLEQLEEVERLLLAGSAPRVPGAGEEGG